MLKLLSGGASPFGKTVAIPKGTKGENVKNLIIKSLLIVVLSLSFTLTGCQQCSPCSSTAVSPQYSALQQRRIAQMGATVNCLGQQMHSMQYSIAQRDEALRRCQQRLKEQQKRAAQTKVTNPIIIIDKREKTAEPKNSLSLLQQKAEDFTLRDDFYKHKSAQELKEAGEILTRLEEYLAMKELRQQVSKNCSRSYGPAKGDMNLCEAYQKLCHRVYQQRRILKGIEHYKGKKKDESKFNSETLLLLERTKRVAGMVTEFDTEMRKTIG